MSEGKRQGEGNAGNNVKHPPFLSRVLISLRPCLLVFPQRMLQLGERHRCCPLSCRSQAFFSKRPARLWFLNAETIPPGCDYDGLDTLGRQRNMSQMLDSTCVKMRLEVQILFPSVTTEAREDFCVTWCLKAPGKEWCFYTETKNCSLFFFFPFNIRSTLLHSALHCIPQCWRRRRVLESPAISYFYIFLLKKKHGSSPTMNCDAFPAEWMENSAMCKT